MSYTQKYDEDKHGNSYRKVICLNGEVRFAAADARAFVMELNRLATIAGVDCMYHFKGFRAPVDIFMTRSGYEAVSWRLCSGQVMIDSITGVRREVSDIDGLICELNRLYALTLLKGCTPKQSTPGGGGSDVQTCTTVPAGGEPAPCAV